MDHCVSGGADSDPLDRHANELFDAANIILCIVRQRLKASARLI